jgi:hypothetical protein
LGFAYVIIVDELVRPDLSKLLTKVDEIIDELLFDNDSDSTTGLIAEKENKLKELKKVVRELKNIEDLEEIGKLTEKLKELNEVMIKNNTENEIIKSTEVKNIIENLKVISEIINGIMHFEGFAEEIKEVENLSKELIEKILKKFPDESNEDNTLEGVINELTTELTKINKLVEELKIVNKFSEEASKFAEKRKSEDGILMREFAEELKIIKDFADKLNKRVKEDNVANNLEGHNVDIIENDDEIKEAENSEKSNTINNFNGNDKKIKRWSYINIKNEIKRWYSEIIKIKNDRGKEEYQKCSKWLKDCKENRIVAVLFVILAGVDITHLEFLSSKIRIRIRWLDIYFNAKLSRASEVKMLWGNFINAIIGDLSLILLQVRNFFYLFFFNFY